MQKRDWLALEYTFLGDMQKYPISGQHGSSRLSLLVEKERLSTQAGSATSLIMTNTFSGVRIFKHFLEIHFSCFCAN